MTRPTFSDLDANEADAAEQWAAATLTPDEVGESPYDGLPPAPSEADPVDVAAQFVEVPFDDEER